MKRRLTVVCLPWHAATSGSVHEVLVRPLAPFADVSVATWDGVAPPALEPGRSAPLVFFQAAPPRELLGAPGVRAVWVPMWDDVRRFPAAWWSSWPASLRVAAFSGAVAERAGAAGLATLRVRYFPAVGEVGAARWDHGPILYYWNRCGLVRPSLLRRLCAATGARALLFRGTLDPGVSPHAEFWPTSRELGIEVRRLPGFVSRDAYRRAVAPANVVVAPRACEGIGLVALEAMERGCAVIALDAAAANEVIEHGANGLLLRAAGRGLSWERVLRVALRWGGLIRPVQRPNPDLVPSFVQDWRGIAAADLPGLGASARRSAIAGRAAWEAALPELAEFLLEW